MTTRTQSYVNGLSAGDELNLLTDTAISIHAALNLGTPELWAWPSLWQERMRKQIGDDPLPGQGHPGADPTYCHAWASNLEDCEQVIGVLALDYNDDRSAVSMCRFIVTSAMERLSMT